MAKRFFTSDLHIGSTVLCELGIRQFRNVERMNEILIKNINQRCNKEDTLISLGDFCQFGNDRKWKGEKVNPSIYINQLNPTFVNIKGNHDDNNKVKSLCDSMRIHLGKKYPSVSVSHYPSNNPKAKGTFTSGDIHLHGHVHCTKDDNGNIVIPPKYSFDFKNKVLNINLNCELWNFNPVSEDELIQFIDKIMREHGKKSDSRV